ncbi:MAG: YggS family pyridoxal phosphate-dependent enzyme [Blastocatellia bacterium]|nr:MAG: YggS family pyridoxal phosphate-dependent enzyme [Blastocatellia bacterium]
MFDPAALRARLATVRERITRAASRAGRDPAAIHVVAISKTFGADHIRAAAEAGQIDFGENKVQEALSKMQETSDLPLRWHLVGHLQSNKARKAGTRFNVIHSLDRVELGDTLEAVALAEKRQLDALVQVDLGGEPTKHGAREQELVAVFDRARSWQAIRLIGLMLLPPAVDNPDDARPYFRALEGIRRRLLAHGVAASMLAELSMGMSHDFEVAIEEGATLVRVGTAIFGSRNQR